MTSTPYGKAPMITATKTRQRQDSYLTQPSEAAPFTLSLARNGLHLVRKTTHTLQINIGLRCNQACTHCHLDAGPDRKEMMDAKTLDTVIRAADRFRFGTIDVTGGAPELHPELGPFMEALAPLTPRLLLRSNLSALFQNHEILLQTLIRCKPVVVASFPSLNAAQAETLRGNGIFDKSIKMLKILNASGFGKPGSPLELDLVINPAGAFLPTSQAETEKRFHRVLQEKWGITFNRLFCIANVPLGRFRQWLIRTGNLAAYLDKLVLGFNPCAVEGVMCRTQVSVSWNGFLFDCDFNQAAGLPLGGRKKHLSQLNDLPAPGAPIAVGDHCYTCTAGAGFS